MDRKHTSKKRTQETNIALRLIGMGIFALSVGCATTSAPTSTSEKSSDEVSAVSTQAQNQMQRHYERLMNRR